MKVLFYILLFFPVSALSLDGSLCPFKDLQRLHGKKLPDGRVDPTFQSTVEFPNLFLPNDLRFKPQSQWSGLEMQKALKSTGEGRDLLEKALVTLFNRLTVPIAAENGEIKPIRYFPHLQEQLALVDQKVKVLPSGGLSVLESDWFMLSCWKGLREGFLPGRF